MHHKDRNSARSGKAAEQRDRVAKLEVWIGLANFIPRESVFTEPTPERVASVWKQWREWKHKNSLNRLRAGNIEQALAMNHPYKGSPGEVDGLIHLVREALDAIVGEFEFHQSYEQDENEQREFAAELPAPTAGPVIFLKPKRSAQDRRRAKQMGLPVSEDNAIEFGAYGQFLEVLKTANLFNIRHCRNCKQLFYASHTNKLACSEQCQAAYRVREWRKKGKEYEGNRQHNKETGFKAKERIILSASLRKDATSARFTEREPHLPTDTMPADDD